MGRRDEDFIERLMASLSIRGILLHPATLFIFASLITMAGAIHLWNKYHSHIVADGAFELTAEKISLTELPVGILPDNYTSSDLKQLILRKTNDEPQASLLDTKLVSKTVNVFRTVGWVERVRSIEKSKSGLAVDLIYRRPIGMVELNNTNVMGWGNQIAKLLPVDRTGVIMPGTLVASHPMLRFSIFNPDRTTSLDTWTEWPDDRIKECASISEVLSPHWQDFGLYRIFTLRTQTNPVDGSKPFELWPDRGTQVIWGSAPGQEIESEATAEGKLAALKAFVEQYGPLNQLPEQRIDIRSGQVVVLSNVKTAVLKSLKDSKLN